MADVGAENIDERLQEAIRTHREGNLSDAMKKYHEVLAIDPEQTDALQLSGVIFAQLGDLPKAIDFVSRSIKIDPDQPGALNNLGNMLVEEERIDEAIEAYERSIYLKPDNAQTHHHLGHTYYLSERLLDSVNAYKKAVDLVSDNVSYWTDYGDALTKIGRFQEAVDSYNEALKIDREYNAPRESLGKALLLLGRNDEARQVYEQWLRRDPGNPVPEHFLKVCRGTEDVPATASKEYVKRTFDDFADSFDSLLQKLHYRVPDLIGDLVRGRYGEEVDDLQVIDLGCGTGLCGRHLRPFAGNLVGVDLSPKMLDKARKRDLYDDLVEQELTEFLSDCSGDQDLMVSADTLIYIGDLRPTFRAAAQRFRPGGRLIFSLEKMVDRDEVSTGIGYRLGVSGRYVHTEDYVQRLLSEHGFSIESFEETAVRKEGFEDVIGFLVTAVYGATERSSTDKD